MPYTRITRASRCPAAMIRRNGLDGNGPLLSGSEAPALQARTREGRLQRLIVNFILAEPGALWTRALLTARLAPTPARDVNAAVAQLAAAGVVTITGGGIAPSTCSAY